MDAKKALFSTVFSRSGLGLRVSNRSGFKAGCDLNLRPCKTKMLLPLGNRLRFRVQVGAAGDVTAQIASDWRPQVEGHAHMAFNKHCGAIWRNGVIRNHKVKSIAKGSSALHAGIYQSTFQAGTGTPWRQCTCSLEHCGAGLQRIPPAVLASHRQFRTPPQIFSEFGLLFSFRTNIGKRPNDPKFSLWSSPP